MPSVRIHLSPTLYAGRSALGLSAADASGTSRGADPVVTQVAIAASPIRQAASRRYPRVTCGRALRVLDRAAVRARDRRLHRPPGRYIVERRAHVVVRPRYIAAARRRPIVDRARVHEA